MFERINIKGNKVAPQEVKDAVKSVSYTQLGDKIVVAHVILVDGFEVIGKAGVVDPNEFDISIGSKFALLDAEKRIWEHMGSILQDRLLTK